MHQWIQMYADEARGSDNSAQTNIFEFRSEDEAGRDGRMRHYDNVGSADLFCGIARC